MNWNCFVIIRCSSNEDENSFQYFKSIVVRRYSKYLLMHDELSAVNDAN